MSPINDERFGLHQQDLVDMFEKHIVGIPTLAIASDATKAKTTNDCYYFIAGKMYLLSAADMTALSGTITDGYYNVWVFAVDSSGNVSATMGTEALVLADIVFPTTPSDEAVIGFVLVYTSGAAFVGGTTDLSDGNVTEVYIDAVGPMRFT